ncbi:hypothetical protein Tco_1530344 [Tanacetum coccineum]
MDFQDILRRNHPAKESLWLGKYRQPWERRRDIRNFNQEGEETLYQAWESTMNRQLLNFYGPIPGMTPAEGLTAIQTMTDHSQKGNDGSPTQTVCSSNNSERMVAIASKLDNIGRDMKNLKENVHAIQVGCQLYDGPHLDKECPLNEDAKGVKEVKYGEPSLEELMNKHLVESTQRSFEMEEWIKKIQESTKINTRNQGASLQNLETQIEQLTKEVHAKAAIEIPTSSVGQCKAVYKDAPINKASTNKTNEIHGVSFFDEEEDDNLVSEGLPCQLPPKEMNPGSFTLPYTIGSLDFYAMADLGASINVIPKIYKCGEEKIDAIFDTVFDKLDDSRFSGETQDEDDLDGITYYLEPTSYDEFIDNEDEAYKEILYKFLGMPYRKPPPILIERVKVTRYNIGPSETYTKTKNFGIDKIPRTSTNVANVHVVLMDELGADGNSFSKEDEFEFPRDDELWKLQKHIHDLTWKLYDSCGVHHVSTEKGIDIYMLVEKEYPLSRGTLTLMLVAKLLVDQDNEMSRELLRKIFMQAERPRR